MASTNEGKEDEHPAVTKLIEKVIEDIWSTYDKDGSGQLEKKELKKFLTELKNEIEGEEKEMDQKQFDKYFKEFDLDGDGVVDRQEMKNFIRRVCGFKDIEKPKTEK